MKTEIVGFRLNERLRDKLDSMSHNLGNDRSKQLTRLVEEAVMEYDASQTLATKCLQEAHTIAQKHDKLEMLEFSKELEYAKSIIGHNHPIYRELSYWKKRIDNKIMTS